MVTSETGAYVTSKIVRTFLLTLFITITGLTTFYRPCLAQIQRPDLTFDSNVVILDEAQKNKVTLTELQCTDLDGSRAPISVDKVSPSKPCGSVCYSILPCPGKVNSWCLQFTPIEALDMLRTDDYVVTVKCVSKNKITVKGFIQVRLFRHTKPPEFASFPKVVTIDETETQEVVLQKITCIDPDNGEVKVDLKVDPKSSKYGCSKCFSLEPCGTEWCLKYLPGVGTLSFVHEPKYPMALACTDPEGKTVDTDIEVRVTKNSPPVFDTLFASETVADARRVPAGTSLYQVEATDDEGDTLFYTMKTTPDVPQLAIGFTDGIIRAVKELSQVCTPKVTCEVKVGDNHNLSKKTMVLDLTLNGANVAPSITNMDEVIQVPEDKKITKLLYRIKVVDEDLQNRMTLTFKTNPPRGQRYFRFIGYDVVLKSPLNYEDASFRTIHLTLTVTDSGGCSSQTKTLTISVTDVNEPPRIINQRVSLIVYEGNIRVQPNWLVDDEDFTDIKKYRIIRGNDHGRFTIDPSTGVITSLVDYNIDNRRMPNQVTLTVEIKDKGGLRTEGLLQLSILDANDMAPYIQGRSRRFGVTECTPLGSVLGTLHVLDQDSSFQGNSRVHIEAVEEGPVSLISSGDVILTSYMTAGQSVTIAAYAMDQGKYPKPLKSKAPVYVTVNCMPCPTPHTRPPLPRLNTLPPPATAPQPTAVVIATTIATPVVVESIRVLGDLTDNIWWLAVAGILALTFLCLLAWMCWKFRCCQSTRPKVSKVKPFTPIKKPDLWPKKVPQQPAPKPPNVTPVLDIPPSETPEPTIVGPIDGLVYDFWKERFNEEDYLGQPDRNRKPDPIKDGSVSTILGQAQQGIGETVQDEVTATKKRTCVIS